MSLVTENLAKKGVIAGGQPTGGSLVSQNLRARGLIGGNTQVPHKQGLVQNVVQGVAKPFLKTATNVLNFGEGVLDLAKGDIAGADQAINKQRDFGYFGKDITGVGMAPMTGDYGKDLGTGVKDILGTGAEIGSYFAPIGGAAGASKAILPTIAREAGFGAIGGALGGAGSELQRADSTGADVLKGAVSGGLAGGLTAGALPAIGKVGSEVGRKVLPVMGGLGAEVLGRTTGAGEAAIKEAFNNPNVMKFARQAGKEGPANLLESAARDAKRGVDMMFSENSKAYKEAIGRIKASPQDMSQAVSKIRSDIVQEAVDGFGVRFTDGKKLNNLDFNASDVVEGTSSVQRAFDRLFGEPISSIEELDRVKKSLGRLGQGAPNGSPAQALIYKMKSKVSEILKSDVPGYAEEMARFSDAENLSDEIERALSLGDKASLDTTMRKLMSTMRQNNELRKIMLESLSGKSGSDITGKIAGATLAPLTPRGLAGVITPSIGGIGLLTSTNTIPAMLLYLASSSPRLVGEAVALLGKVKGTTIPLVIKKQLQNLMIQAAREASSEKEGTEQMPQKSQAPMATVVPPLR